ncbi:hypothetical protein [Fodinibius sediminis]|nr:hypothetical protein [Fodinibius sediminis]
MGGKVHIRDRHDNPNMEVPDEYTDKVLHARYQCTGNMIMANDVFPG